MLNDLIFSIATVSPIFIVMATGYLLRRTGRMSEAFAAEANRLLVRLIMPLKLAGDLWRLDLSDGFPIADALYISGGIVLTALIALLVARLMGMPRRAIGTFVHGAYRGNYIYIGMSLLLAITGRIDPKAPLVVIFTITLYNVIGVLVLGWSAAEAPDGPVEDRWAQLRLSLVRALRNIVTNPFIIGIAAGVILNRLRVPLPSIIDRSFGFFSNLATPLALLAIGASFDLRSSARYRAWSLMAAALKLVVYPVLGLLGAYAMGLRGDDLVIIYLIFGVPTAVSSYAIVVELDGDAGLAASIILYTTLLSVLSSTAFVFAFRLLGWV